MFLYFLFLFPLTSSMSEWIKSAAWKPLHHSDIISEEWVLGYFTHSSEIMSELGQDEKSQERENNSNENKCYWLAKNILKGL